MAGEIFQWNINGIKCQISPNYKDKINQITSILEKNSSTAILNIQETHISSETELPDFVNLYKHIYHFQKTFSEIEDPSAGILICIRKTEEIIDTEELEKGRLLYIKTKNTANNEVNHFSQYIVNQAIQKNKRL